MSAVGPTAADPAFPAQSAAVFVHDLHNIRAHSCGRSVSLQIALEYMHIWHESVTMSPIWREKHGGAPRSDTSQAARGKNTIAMEI
jgi:hypothetical protein